MLAAGRPRPPQWAGLKLFNVFGPNEYHKGPMISVVKVKHDEVVAGLAPRFCVFAYCVLALIAIPSKDRSGPLPCVRQRTQGDLAPLGAQTTYRPSSPDS